MIESPYLSALFRAPQANGAIFSAGNKDSAIGTECHASHAG
jgi:hypothetical protein